MASREPEFSKALEKGQISAKAAEVALIRLTEKGGKYANGAIAQSDTLFGKLSTLQDAVSAVWPKHWQSAFANLQRYH